MRFRTYPVAIKKHMIIFSNRNRNGRMSNNRNRLHLPCNHPILVANFYICEVIAS